MKLATTAPRAAMATAWSTRPTPATATATATARHRAAFPRAPGERPTTKAKIPSSARGATRRRRSSPLARATASEDGDDEPVSSASGTISALDALLGSADEPEPEPEPEPARGDDETTTKGEGVSPDGAEAAGWPSLSLPDLPWGASSRGGGARGEDDEERAIVRRAMENARAERSKSSSSKSANGSRVDYAVDEPYDPDFDPLGLGPRWEVPWGAPTLIATLIAVEASFYLAGALAPAIVYSGARSSDEIPFDDQEAFAKDLAALFDEPGAFADIVITAEVIQTVLALGVVAAVASSASPLPPGWFQFSLTGDDVSMSDGPRVQKRSGPDGGDSPDGDSPVARSLRTGRPSGSPAASGADFGADFAEKRRAQRIRAERRARSEDWLGEAARASAWVWGAVILVTALSYVTGLRGDESGTASNSTIEKAFDAGPGGALSLFLTTVVLAPLLEETVFRGFMLPTLTRWMDTRWALAATTIAFALVHEHNTGDTVQLLAVGAVAGVAYCRTRNLLASMAVHASFNLGVLVLFALWTHS